MLLPQQDKLKDHRVALSNSSKNEWKTNRRIDHLTKKLKEKKETEEREMLGFILLLQLWRQSSHVCPAMAAASNKSRLGKILW